MNRAVRVSWRLLLFISHISVLEWTDICTDSLSKHLLFLTCLWTDLRASSSLRWRSDTYGLTTGLNSFSCRFWLSSVCQQPCSPFLKDWLPIQMDLLEYIKELYAPVWRKQPSLKIFWWTCEPLEKRKSKPLKKEPISTNVSQVFLWRTMCTNDSVYADDEMWQIVKRILACQTSCDSCWFIMRMLSPQPVRTREFFARLPLLPEPSTKTSKTFKEQPQEQKNSHWNKKCSSCQPANQHTQLWSYLALTPQPPLIGPLLPRYSAHCCAVGP